MLLFRRLHFSVDIAHFVLWECFADQFISLLKAAQVELFILLYQWIHDVCLSSGFELFAYALVYAHARCVVAQKCGDRLSSGRQLVDHRYAEIAIYRHCQGAGDGCGCHDEHMRRRGVLVP